MTLLNIFNTIADSNLAYYLLVIVLLIVVISMVYLIYSQNKEINEARKKREQELVDTIHSNTESDMIIDLASELKKEKEGLSFVEDEEEVKESNLILESKKEEDIIPEPEKLDIEKVEKVEKVENVDLPREKKIELIDATLTNIPRVSLLEETMTAIPQVLDYANETEELVNITKELENLPKERTIKLTPYEEEQEQTAIISYDELINGDGVVYDEINEEDGLSIKKVDLDKTTEIDLGKELERPIPRETYAHEELFLQKLKSLQSKIN